jgi:hypothetical protein
MPPVSSHVWHSLRLPTHPTTPARCGQAGARRVFLPGLRRVQCCALPLTRNARRPAGDRTGATAWFAGCEVAAYQMHTRMIDRTDARSPGLVCSKGLVVIPGASALRRSPADGRADPICQPRPQQCGSLRDPVLGGARAVVDAGAM